MDIDMEDVESKPPVNNTPPPRRKLTRQTPLSKDSPSRVRRSHTIATSTTNRGLSSLFVKTHLHKNT